MEYEITVKGVRATEGSGRFLFSGRIPAEQRAALERLVFFNEHQYRVRGVLREVIERWGCPEIVEEDGFLRVQVAGNPAVQCLFASQARASSLRPLGVVVYVRDCAERITVLHVGLAADYAAGGRQADAHLLGRLLHEVKRVARRTAGIRAVKVAYREVRRPAADAGFGPPGLALAT